MTPWGEPSGLAGDLFPFRQQITWLAQTADL